MDRASARRKSLQAPCGACHVVALMAEPAQTVGAIAYARATLSLDRGMALFALAVAAPRRHDSDVDPLALDLRGSRRSR